MTSEEILLNEFGTYYLADELPSVAPSELGSWLPDWARNSALRMRAEVGETGTAELASLLRAIREDRNHPLIPKLTRESNIAWRDDDAWPGLQAIRDEIARNLEAPSGGD